MSDRAAILKELRQAVWDTRLVPDRVWDALVKQAREHGGASARSLMLDLPDLSIDSIQHALTDLNRQGRIERGRLKSREYVYRPITTEGNPHDTSARRPHGHALRGELRPRRRH